MIEDISIKSKKKIATLQRKKNIQKTFATSSVMDVIQTLVQKSLVNKISLQQHFTRREASRIPRINGKCVNK